MKRITAHRLDRIIDKVYNKVWCIDALKHKAIRDALEAHLNGNGISDYLPMQDDQEQQPYDILGNTAIIPIEGTILNKCSGLEAMCGAFSLQTFKSNLRTVAADDNVENIILNIDSGGGIITGVPEAANLIAQVAQSKTVYAFTDDCIGSAAYWLASQANCIFTTQSAETGSIGVYLGLLDVSAAMQLAGIKAEVFKAGANKAMGFPGTSLTDEQRTILQNSVNKSMAQFTGYVTSKRPNIPAEAMNGLMFDSQDGIKYGLIDGVVDDLDSLVDYLNAA